MLGLTTKEKNYKNDKRHQPDNKHIFIIRVEH